MVAALNLSNEVVKMRGEVKRVKVLIIRKLTRQIVALKKKKGTEADLERNQRRAARLLEEIHQLKTLAPDSVTKAALQSDISFEKVCQKKDSSLVERATARIATHPEFNKRIQSIKNAIAAFKAERTSAGKKGKESRDQTDSEEDDHEEASEGEEDDAPERDDEVGSSLKDQKADEEQLRIPTQLPFQSSPEADHTPAEVVRMRKEVKKLRVLIIRNLTQQIVALKKAKAEAPEVEGNAGCAARLQKEVRVLRTLLPDRVTVRALEGGVDVEKVFQDPESSAVERATARIVTHERFLKKLQDVRQAIEKEKATKAERTAAEDGDGGSDDDDDSEEEEEVAGDYRDDDDDDDAEDDNKKEDEKEKNLSVTIDQSSSAGILPLDTSLVAAKENPKRVQLEKAVPKSTSKPALKAVQSLPPKSKAGPPPLKHVSKPDTKNPETSNDQEESDLSDSEEEKEYFDDSTEERFRKQSSYSEQSDDDDDFFLGKVSKLKKKKSHPATGLEKTNEPNKPREKMQSVFCSTLSKSTASCHRGPKALPLQNRERVEKPSWVKSQGSGRETKPAGLRNLTPGSRGGDKYGKPAFDRKNTPSHKAGKHSQQSLHPSWEASKKRKEQQAQITAFQGKKIKFNDDDDD